MMRTVHAMNRPLYSLAIGTGLCLTIFAQGEPVMAQASRPIDDMRGDTGTIHFQGQAREAVCA